MPIEAINSRDFRLSLPSRDRRGLINADWWYNFLEYKCVFCHTGAAQKLDVCLEFNGEFGVLDPNAFSVFLATTPEYKPLTALLTNGSYSSLRVLEVMHRAGLLQCLTTPEGRSGYFALPAEP